MVPGPEMKAEGKHFMEKRDGCDNSKYKFTGNEEENQTRCSAALDMGQKGLNNCTEMTENSLNWTSLSDYEQLSYNSRSNLFQGGPLKSRSLMKDSYTPDTIQKAIIDPKNWHGKRISELGRWYEKYFLDRNVQKAMKDKHGGQYRNVRKAMKDKNGGQKSQASEDAG